MRQLADSGGSVSLAQGYTPFGVPLWSEGGGTTGYGFTGERWEAYSELLFLRARYYQPGTGRFISRDLWSGSLENPGTLHRYAYVLNNAPNRVDPTGRAPNRILFVDPCAQEKCDPNNELAVQWLLARMRGNRANFRAASIRSLNHLALSTTPSLPFVPWLPIGAKAAAYGLWIEAVAQDHEWDFKDQVRWNADWGGKSIRMCRGCHSYENPANIHYGYVGKACGFSTLELRAGAGMFNYLNNRKWQSYQKRIAEGEVNLATYYDEPEDQAGIQLGIELFESRLPITPKRFCEVFDKWAPRLKPASQSCMMR